MAEGANTSNLAFNARVIPRVGRRDFQEEAAGNTDGQDDGLTMRRFGADLCMKEEEIFVEPECDFAFVTEDGACLDPLNTELDKVDAEEEHDFEEEPAVKNEPSSEDENGACFDPLNPELDKVEVKEEHDFEGEPAIKNEPSSEDEEEASNTYWQDDGLTLRRFDGKECVKEEEIFVESEFGNCAPDGSTLVDNNDGKGPCPCNLCNYGGTRPGDLTGERRYPCKLCYYRGTQPGYLKRHMRTHTGEKPYPCKLCDYKSAERGNLSKHMRIHEASNQFWMSRRSRTSDSIQIIRSSSSSRNENSKGRRPADAESISSDIIELDIEP